MSVSTRTDPGSTQTVSPLRQARIQRGLTLPQAATLAQIDIGHLSRIERGHSVPTVTTLYRLAGVLNLRKLRNALAPFIPDDDTNQHAE